MMIYHLAKRIDWEAALQAGSYRCASLLQGGFIHCSHARQLPVVLKRYFQPFDDLVLLQIDPLRLQVKVRYENLHGDAELFPHLYGHLNLDAIQTVFQLETDENGQFILPAEIME